MSTWIAQSRGRLPRLAENAVERARLTLVPRQERRAPRVPFLVLVAAVLLTGVVGLLVFNTHMQQTSFQATALEAKATTLHAQEQALRMELDTLRDPQRVAQRARALGMVPIANPAFLQISDGTVLGEAVPAAATDAQRLTPLPTRRPDALMPPAPTVTPDDLVDDATGADADGAPSTGSGPSDGTNESPTRR
jgi:cell division protein FtsB